MKLRRDETAFAIRTSEVAHEFGFTFMMSVADHRSPLAKKVRTTKSVRWANPFLKAFGKRCPRF